MSVVDILPANTRIEFGRELGSLCSAKDIRVYSLEVGSPAEAKPAEPAEPAARETPRSDIDAVAHQIAVALFNYVAQMNADPELDAALRRNASVALDHAVLHLDGAAHGVARRLPLMEDNSFTRPFLVNGNAHRFTVLIEHHPINRRLKSARLVVLG
jgi:hypothetical protein